MSVDRIRYHVRMGRGHGYPDCCIQEYVRTHEEELPEEEKRLMVFARRRLCDACKARMLKQADYKHVKASRQIEAWMSGARFCIFQIVHALGREVQDRKRIREHRRKLIECIFQVVRLEKAQKSLTLPE